MDCRAFWERKRQHILSDLATSAKYLEVKKSSRRSRRMESCEQKRNATNLLHSRLVEIVEYFIVVFCILSYSWSFDTDRQDRYILLLLLQLVLMTVMIKEMCAVDRMMNVNVRAYFAVSQVSTYIIN